ncbi:MAG: hypothetical protein HUN04_23690 [Desulfobacter sp.]|nr:MAG: hypothetical protein HUN04_23690 [Desulfobacter sp.]
MTNQETSCPYCGDTTGFEMPLDYAPVFVWCESCKKKFIIERLAKGFEAMTIEAAPSCSDPDRRAIEMGGGQEE